MGKSTISMATFNSFLYVHQRVPVKTSVWEIYRKKSPGFQRRLAMLRQGQQKFLQARWPQWENPWENPWEQKPGGLNELLLVGFSSMWRIAWGYTETLLFRGCPMNWATRNDYDHEILLILLYIIM